MKINKEEDNHRDRTDLDKLSALLDKYVKGDCTTEERHAIEEWYESLAGERETTASEELSAKLRIWAGIRSTRESLASIPEKVLASHRHQWLQWAASIAIFCVSSVFAYMYMQEEQPPFMVTDVSGPDWTIHSNSTSDEMRLLLPDNSRITLQPGAIVGYPKMFNESERLVKLDGEAFFEIEKDAGRPFKVITGDITTRVLGTSFNVKAIGDKSVIEIDVRTGKVSVYEHNHADSANTEGVVLTPNQKVTYYKKEKKWVAELVRDPAPVAAVDEAAALVFRDEQMRNVLQRIAELYCIEIIVVNDAIYDCPFTGDVSHMELYDMLKLICKSIRSDYDVRGTRILIDGTGCP